MSYGRMCRGVVLWFAVLAAALPLRAGAEVSAPSKAGFEVRGPIGAAWAHVLAHPELLQGVGLGDLRARLTFQDATRTVVELQQTWQGLDVVGAAVIVRVDAAHRVPWATSTTRHVAPDLAPVPTLSGEAAIAELYARRARLHTRRELDVGRHARLVVWAPRGQHARLAWEVLLPPSLLLLETLRAFVDAETGAVLLAENLVKRDRSAWVFENNPVTSPTPVTATLSSLSSGATQLDDADLLARTCIDNQGCQPLDFNGSTLNVHMCDFEPSAQADGSGDFVAYVRPASDLEPEDPFAEVQVYYHASQALAFFRGLDPINLNQRPMQLVANFRMPAFDLSAICLGPTNSGPLFPIDLAAFYTEGGLIPGYPSEEMILVGQGTGADFAYDGDVIHHEMGHAVAAAVSAIGVAVGDEYGLDTTPGGMSEAYADYWAAVMADDAAIGEYVAPSLGLAGHIRTIDNADTCPSSLSGELHQDSLPWSGALWEIRSSLATGMRAAFDMAVYTTFTAINVNDTMLTVRDMLEAELVASLGATVAGSAAAILDARGFDDCNQRVVDLAADAEYALMYLAGFDVIEVALVPGPVQLRFTLPEDAQEISVSIVSSQAIIPGGSAPAVHLLAKAGSEPILWDWSGADPTHDAVVTGELTFGTGPQPGTGSVTGDFPAGPVHLMLANAGETLQLAQITLSYVAAPPTTDSDPGADDAGCGCGAGAGDPALLGLGALLLVLRRAWSTVPTRRPGLSPRPS
jgi:hypothetical protein